MRGIEVTRNTYDFISWILFSIFFLFYFMKLNYDLSAIILLQVIMDVVFNHTAEGNENGPIISFRGVDNSMYYMLAPKVSSVFLLSVSASLVGVKTKFLK